MKLATPSQMKKLDDIAIQEYKIPGIILMENAANQVAKKAREIVPYPNKIVVVAGKGNNGGDAFAAARHLHQWGYPVSVVSLVQRGNIASDAEIFLHILENLDIDISYITHDNAPREMMNCLNNAYLIIDGVFGTGIHGEVTGIFAQAIQAINESSTKEHGPKVLSVDIPSGVNGETGQVCGIAVKAHETLTFSLPKPGLWQYPGRAYAGKITTVDIGIPLNAIQRMALSGEILDISAVSRYLPERAVDGHKGTFGRVLIITGSTGMTGAGTLAAKAAFKTGSGLVYLAVPESLSQIYGITVPEAITVPLKERNGVIATENLTRLVKLSESMDAVVIGPGLAAKSETEQWVGAFICDCFKPMVIDADALNVITPDILYKRKVPTVLTPHPGEFAALSGDAIDAIQKNRVEKALNLSRRCNSITILKGAGTVIACPEGSYAINTSGHPCLAVAGSGDVLSGITGSLLGQKLTDEHAAKLAVFVHGRCGEVLAGRMGEQGGCQAGDICNEIPIVMEQIRLEAQRMKEG